jgi:hypothetical protein
MAGVAQVAAAGAATNAFQSYFLSPWIGKRIPDTIATTQEY